MNDLISLEDAKNNNQKFLENIISDFKELNKNMNEFVYFIDSGNFKKMQNYSELVSKNQLKENISDYVKNTQIYNSKNNYLSLIFKNKNIQSKMKECANSLEKKIYNPKNKNEYNPLFEHLKYSSKSFDNVFTEVLNDYMNLSQNISSKVIDNRLVLPFEINIYLFENLFDELSKKNERFMEISKKIKERKDIFLKKINKQYF
jgi:hypothetical protein